MFKNADDLLFVMKRALLLVLLLTPLVMAVHLPANYTCTSTVVKQFGDDAGHLARVGTTYYTYDADDNFYYSIDWGSNWIKRGEKGIEYLTSAPDAPLNATSRGLYAVHEYLAANDAYPYKAVVYHSTSGGNSWEQAGNTIRSNERAAKFKVFTLGYSAVGWSQAHAKHYRLYPNGNWYLEKDFSNSFPSSWSVTLPEMLHYGSRTWAVVNGRTEAGQQQTKIYSFYTGTYDNFTLQSTLTGNAVGNAMIGYGGALYLLIKTTDTLSMVRRSTNLGSTWTTVLTASNKVPVRISANSTHGINVVFSNGDLYRSWDGQEWKLAHNINQTSIKDLLFTTYRHYSIITAGNKVISLVCNAWPVAKFTNPYSSHSVHPGTQVTLDASPSSDSDKDIILPVWVQASGTAQNISNRSSAVASVNISQPGTYVFTLKLRDNGFPSMPPGAFSTKNFTVIVYGAGATPTSTPTPQPEEHVEATPIPEEPQEPTPPPQAVTEIPPEATPEPTVQATATPPTAATTTQPTEATPAPTPGTITPTQGPGIEATPTPTSLPIAPPTVEAAVARISAREGEIVVMQALGRDALGRQLTFSWRQLSGRPVQLEQSTTDRPSFVAPAAGVYEFEAVAVSPDGRRSAAAAVTVIVEESRQQVGQQNSIVQLLQSILDLLRRIFGG